MTKGIAKGNYPASEGLVRHSDTPNWDYLYSTSLTRDARWNIGDRVVLPDGRVFRYAKASNAIPTCKFGVKFWNTIANGIGTTLTQGQAVGDKTILITGTATVDEYRGGYVMIHVGTHQQFRGILGNDPTDGNGDVKIYLDAAVSVAVTTSHFTEVMQSPYSNVKLTAGPSGGQTGNDFTSVAGIPNVITASANQFVWLQTWGPIWINPHGSSLQDAGIAAGERKLVFDLEGSVTIEDDVAHGAGGNTDEHQIAGFIIDRNSAGTSGPPLVMLQISP